jgi:hypothetical protein
MKAESLNLIVTVKDTLTAIDGLAVKTTGQDKVVSSLYKNHGSTGLSVVCMAATELLETTAVDPDRAGNEGKQHAVIKTLRTSLKRATIEKPKADGTQAYKTFEFDKDNVAVIVDKVTRPKVTKDDTKVGEEGEEGEANVSNMSKSLRAVWAGFIKVADDKVIKSMIRYFVKVAGYAPVKLTKV